MVLQAADARARLLPQDGACELCILCKRNCPGRYTKSPDLSLLRLQLVRGPGDLNLMCCTQALRLCSLSFMSLPPSPGCTPGGVQP